MKGINDYYGLIMPQEVPVPAKSGEFLTSVLPTWSPISDLVQRCDGDFVLSYGMLETGHYPDELTRSVDISL